MFKVDSAGIRKQLKWSRRTHSHTLAYTHTHSHVRTHTHTLARAHTHTRTRAHTLARAHTHSHAHSRTHISSSIANLTASWYFIKIKYSEPNISAASSVSRWHSLFFCWWLSNSVALLRAPPFGLGVNCLYSS